MSSSEDDRPLARSRPKGAHSNGTETKQLPIGPSRITSAMDREAQRDVDRMNIDENASKATAGVSLQNGPVRKVPVPGGNKSPRGKRKVVRPAIKEESGSESDQPLTKRRRTNGVKSNGAAVVSSDDDVPLATKRRKSASPRTETKKPPVLMGKEDTSDSDVPMLSRQLAKEKNNIKAEAAKTAKNLQAGTKKAAAKKRVKSEDSDSDVPITKKRAAPAKKANGVKKQGSSDDDDKPLAKRQLKKASAVKKEPAVKGKGKGKAVPKEETPAAGTEDGEEEEYKWWEHQAETDGTQKWTTLEHNGVLFPPDYVRLPEDVRMWYGDPKKGQVPVILPEAAEEVANFYGAMLDSPHTKNPKFNANFFADFSEILKKSGGAKGKDGKKIAVEHFEWCNFDYIFDYHVQERNAKKAMSAQQKKEAKLAKEALEKDYQWCTLDGRKEKVGNFRIEPPGLFRGRGDHPKTGKVKQRVTPDQVTINIGKEAEVPEPPAGTKWGEVRNDNTVTWLATWKENINGNIKYVMLAATSSLKGQSDYKKFEKARELKKHIGRIRTDYTKALKSEMMADRQRATAMYLIDEFALRAGNEKGEDEADTVGCCSLRYEHITLEPPNKVVFDFLGKDSIRFYQEVQVTPQVFKNLRIFKKEPKGKGDMIFDRLDTTSLNKHLQSYMPGLSAKVFRTYNASWTMQQQLKEIPNKGTVMDKYAAYNEANRKVAILCNHQRTVSSTHETSMQNAQEKLKGLRYQKLRLKRQILSLQPSRQKKNPDFFKPDPEIDDEGWIRKHQKDLIKQEDEKIRKKFEKENAKLVLEGGKEMDDSELEERLEVLKEMEREFNAENKSGKVEPKMKGPTVEKIEAQLEKMEERIRKTEVELSVKDANKTVALGTSKINYIDPRLTVMFCKKYNVPIEKLFPKTLREKFKWALESADENWEF